MLDTDFSLGIKNGIAVLKPSVSMSYFYLNLVGLGNLSS